MTIKDKSGFQTTGYMPIYDPTEVPNCWAYFKQLGGSLFYASATTNVKEECLFRVNRTDYLRGCYANDIFVYYANKVYQVTRIDPFEDYDRDLVLYAKVTNNNLSPIFDYDPTKL